MKTIITLASGFFLVLSLARCAYSKHCYGNGVCRVVENGQERYEGHWNLYNLWNF